MDLFMLQTLLGPNSNNHPPPVDLLPLLLAAAAQPPAEVQAVPQPVADSGGGQEWAPLLGQLNSLLLQMGVPPPAECPCPSVASPASLLPRPQPIHNHHHHHLLPLCALPNFQTLQLHKNIFSLGTLKPDPLTSADFYPAQSRPLATPPSTAPSSNGSTTSASLSRCAAASASGSPATVHRLSYPREFKLVVLNSFWANGQNKYRTCKEFQITKSMLNGWLQKADRIRQSRPGSLKSGRSGRRPQFPTIERQLFELVQHHQQQTADQRPSNKWIREMARKLTEAEQGGGGGGSGTSMCQFSERWLNNFKRRYGIQTEQQMPTKAEETEAEGEAEEEGRATAKMVEAVSPPNSPSSSSSSSYGSSTPANGGDLWQEHEWRSIAREICAAPDCLPIQAFYARFPKVLQASCSGAKASPTKDRRNAT